MSANNYNIFWRSYKDIDVFTKTMLESINYLHQKKICHLDIKPENIMINTRTRHFKIIDFGFTDVEPFNNYTSDFRGTPGYFPKYFPNEKKAIYAYIDLVKRVSQKDLLFNLKISS